jgi:hypothetical protein
MKRFISIITLFFVTTSLYANYTMEIKGGLSLNDSYKIGSETFDGRLTYNAAAEILYATTDNTEVGVGISFKANSPTSGEFYSSDSNSSMHLFDSFPIYGIAKYSFPELGQFQPYVRAYLGMSWNSVGSYEYIESCTPGLHTGLGLGGIYGNVIVDLSYVLTQSSITFYHDSDGDNSYTAETRDAKLTSLTLTVGYKFEIGFLN